MDFMGLIGTIIAIGGVMYGIITRFNHIEHIREEIRSMKDQLGKIEEKLDKHGEEIGFLRGKTNGRDK